jgi:hypothetical protein
VAVNQVRRNGSYAPLSAHYYKDDALAAAGEKAELLYVRGLAFCADVLSDGFISDTQLGRFPGVGMRDAKARADVLASTKTADGDTLWRRDDERGGWWVSAWGKWNRSAEEIAEKQKQDAERKAGGRK